MYAYHTTEAFILQAFPHGESNKVYKLLTRELGLLYAHAQSVRELKSRNRYALQTGELSVITLIKGRETWRLTGAQTDSVKKIPVEGQIYKKRMLHLLGTLLAIEDKTEELFDVLKAGNDALIQESESFASLIEIITVLRLLDVLGYLARPLNEPLVEEFLGISELTPVLLEKAHMHKHALLMRVNNALEVAK